MYQAYSVPSQYPMRVEVIIQEEYNYVFELNPAHSKITCTNFQGHQESYPTIDLADLDKWVFGTIMSHITMSQYNLRREGDEIILVECWGVGLLNRKKIEHKENKFEKTHLKTTLFAYSHSNIGSFFKEVEKFCFLRGH